MAGTTPIYGLPYPQSSDLVSAYPALGQDLAEDLDGILASKLDKAGGKVLQVVNATASTAVTTTTTTKTDTGLSASITPSSTSSKILVLVTQQFYIYRAATFALGAIYLLRGSTEIFGGGTYTPGTQIGGEIGGATSYQSRGFFSCNYLDNPGTTSSVTYKTQQASRDSATLTTQIDTHHSTITLLEVSA